jgi:hypothetical protein
LCAYATTFFRKLAFAILLLPLIVNAQNVIWNFNNNPVSYTTSGFFGYTQDITSTQFYIFEVRMTNSHPYNGAALSIQGTDCTPGNSITKFLYGSSSNPLKQTVGFTLQLPANTPQCATYTLEYRILIFGSSQIFQDWTGKTFTVNDFAHVNPSTLNIPDLMIRDHDRNGPVVIGQTRSDFGEEPYQDWSWAWDYRNITKSPDMWNRHLNDNATIFQNPMHSIQSPPNANYAYVRIRNRGCASTPSDAQLNLYWTIARLWEPWARDWRNFNRYGNISSENKISTPIGDRPLGGAITLQDIYNYASDEFRINLGTFNGGEVKTIAAPWIVPDPAWYMGNTTLPIQFSRQNGLPVICLLARIDEGWRTNEGYYFNPSVSAGTGIVEYVSPNNNVSTNNTHMINNNGVYKWRDNAGNPRGEGGMIGVTGPNGGDAGVIHIAVVRDTLDFTEEINLPDFTQHGTLRLYLDSVLWSRWLSGGGISTGITIDTTQVLIVNDPQTAVLYNIYMEENELAWMATDALQIPGAEPTNDYICGFSIGAFDSTNQRTIGSPTHFEWSIVANPTVAGENASFTSVKKVKENISTIQLYPNPAKDFVMVNIQNLESDLQFIAVYDVRGKQIMKLPITKNQLLQPYKLDISALQNGVYYIELSGNNQRIAMQKLVK